MHAAPCTFLACRSSDSYQLSRGDITSAQKNLVPASRASDQSKSGHCTKEGRASCGLACLHVTRPQYLQISLCGPAVDPTPRHDGGEACFSRALEIANNQ
jgi:hypothetical protein